MTDIRKHLENYKGKSLIPVGMVVKKTDRWGSIEIIKVLAIYQNTITEFQIEVRKERSQYMSMHSTHSIFRIIRSGMFDIICDDQKSQMHYVWLSGLSVVVNAADFFEAIIKRLERNPKVVDEFDGFNLVLDYNPKLTNFMVEENAREIKDIEKLLTEETEYVKVSPTQIESIKELFKINLRHFKCWGEK